MAFSLLAESPRPVDWVALNQALSFEGRVIEVFPIPAEGADSRDRVGISVPGKAPPDRVWSDLTKAFEVLCGRFGMTLMELYSGQLVEELELLREYFS